jgi:hypothetical protein
VGLVDDHEVEVPGAEAALPALRLVDQSHHGQIRRNENPTLGVFLRHQVHRRCIRQMALESVHGLIHQRHTVRQEEHALGPVAAHEQIRQRDDGPCFPRAGRHDE